MQEKINQYLTELEQEKDITILLACETGSRAWGFPYLNMARKTYADVRQEDTFKLKKFFYALRTATACRWILERDEMPPIVFPEMLDGLSIERPITARIEELITLKQTQDESYLHRGESELMHFIETCLTTAQQKAPSLPAAQATMEDLNAFFRATLAN